MGTWGLPTPNLSLIFLVVFLYLKTRMPLIYIKLFHSMVDLSTARTKAINKFNKLRRNKIFCPAINKEVKFTDEAFSHITYKDKSHRRSNEEQAMRFLCFLSVEDIIIKSHLYQEYTSKTENIEFRIWTTNHYENRIVHYYWLVAITEKKWEKHRIKVVIRYVEGYVYAEYHTVFPAWRTEWYRNFYGSLNW